MRIVDHLRSWLPAALVLTGCLAARAAPAPAPRGLSEKYIPDDASFVLVVNVKQLANSPVYTRHFRKKIDDLLKNEQAPQWARDLGAIVPRDVERLAIALGCSSYPTDQETYRAGPTIIMEGRLDALRALLKQLAKEYPDHVRELKIANATAHEIVGSHLPEGFVVQADPNTLIFSPRREEVVEALDKASGKNKNRVKNKAVGDLLARLKPDAAIQWVGTKDMVLTTSVRVSSDVGRNVREVTVTTLADSGIDSLIGSIITARDDLKCRAALTGKDEATAKQLTERITQFLDAAKANLKRAPAAEPQRASLLKALDALKVSRSDLSVTFEGAFDAPALEGLVVGFFTAAGPAPPGPVPIDVPPPKKP
jgi:hypothetical protein